MVLPCDSVHIRFKCEVAYQRTVLEWLKWLVENPKAAGKIHDGPRFFYGEVKLEIYFVYGL